MNLSGIEIRHLLLGDLLELSLGESAYLESVRLA
jgi:hypothetical protein